jgi:hypothetical protein
MRTPFVLFPVLVLLTACGGGGDPDLATPAQCNPLGGVNCITPWPSGIYEVDATNATGRQLDVPAGALPTNIDGIAIEPTRFNLRDGFSSSAPMIMAFETGVDPANLVPSTDIGASLTAASPTVVIDMATGELVPHFAEVDAAATDRPAEQALYIRPAVMLKGSTRYAVAIKRTLKARGGAELAIPEGFASILSGERTSHALLERVRPRYDAIFASLAAHGITPADLVTAWDFTTASRASVRADLVAARDATLAASGTDGANLAFTVATNVPTSDPLIAARIDGEYDAPLFLNNGGNPGGASQLLRDANGLPAPSGLYRAPFTAIIPQCALDSPTPVPMVIYGHGLLGDSGQVASAGMRAAAAGVCMVAVGTDMRGMSDIDVPNVALALNDVNNGGLIFDTLLQGMANHVALVQLARGAMATDLFVDTGGASIVDPDRFFYYGISQGGIMGTTVCAIDPVIERCVLQVGAINYSLMLERSLDWPLYGQIVEGAYPDALDVALILNLMQHEWDRTEPTSVADIIVGEGFPGTPTKQVFMQIAIGDVEVANIASEYQARTMGIPVLTPSPYVPYGLEASAGPVPSGLVIYDFGVGATIPPTNEPPPDNDVHSGIRKREATIDMMREFLLNGNVTQMCTAPTGCDCVNDGCGAEL